MAITVSDVNKRFGDFVALDDVSLEVAGGSLTALLGPSGSGKSTLLRVIAGLEVPDSGTVVISGEDATNVPVRKRGVGFVFQHYAAFKHMTVRDNVAFGLRIRKRSKAEIRDRVDELLSLVQLDGHGGPLPEPALGRPAPAHGPRPRPRRGAQGAAAGRALRRPRRPRAQGAAHLAAPPARGGPPDHRAGHARPGGGHGGGRPHRRHGQGRHPAGRLAPRGLRAPGQPVRDDLRRAPPPAWARPSCGPHDLELRAEPNGITSQATVLRLVHLGFEVRVELEREDGAPISAQVTREEADTLALEPGSTVYVRPDQGELFTGGRLGRCSASPPGGSRPRRGRGSRARWSCAG